jgi:RimJ/RimL family protein N-acetyltransferase
VVGGAAQLNVRSIQAKIIVNHVHSDSSPSGGKITGPAYRIETARLVVRCWEPADAAILKRAIDSSTSHLRPWMPWATIEPAPIDDRLQFLRQGRGKFDLGQDFTYGVFDKNETEVIGGTGLHTRHGFNVREIGYWIHEKEARSGYATEVAAALTKVAFEIDEVDRVEIHCAVENYKSAVVPKKLGFINEGNRRKITKDADGKVHDCMIWTMLKEEYPSSIPSKVPIEAFDAIGRRIL